MIRPALTVATFLMLTLLSCAQTQQYFEGKITYTFEFVSKSPSIDENSIKDLLGTGSTLIFKNGNFMHKFEGGALDFDMYLKSENKAYFKKRDSDTLYWYDCSSQGSKIESLVLTEKIQTVVGIPCKELIIKYPDRTETQYFNSDSVRIDPHWFADFLKDGTNLIDQKQKSIYLKQIIEFPYASITELATNISRGTVDDAVFFIPKNAILVEQQ